MRFQIGSAMLVVALASQQAAAQSQYANPVDSKVYVTSGEFKRYEPDQPRDTRGQRVTTQEIVLQTGDDDLQARITVEDLTGFIKSAETKAYNQLDKNKSAISEMIQFNCLPGKCEIKMASQGKAEQAVLQGLYNEIAKLPALITKGEVVFQLVFNVKGSM